jgi:hypothetical protein
MNDDVIESHNAEDFEAALPHLNDLAARAADRFRGDLGRAMFRSERSEYRL